MSTIESYSKTIPLNLDSAGEEIRLRLIKMAVAAASSGVASFWQSSHEIDGILGNYQPSTLC